MRFSLLGLILVTFALGSLSQEAPPGMNAAAQLRFGLGARALGMGSAFTAVAAGPDGIYWNPATLAEQSASVTGMYTEPFGGGIGGIGYRLQYLGAVLGLDGFGFGAAWFNSHVSGIPWTDGGGTFDYDSSVYFLSGALAREDAETGARISVGGSLKIYRDAMLEGSALGFGFDLGVSVDLGTLRLAYCSQDVGRTRYRWHGTGQEPVVYVPWVHRFGMAVSLLDGRLWGAVDLAVEPGETIPLLWRFGLEVIPVEWLALRGGIRLDSFGDTYHPVFTVGLGISWGRFGLDYAFLLNPLPAEVISTSTHIFSMDVKF